jgi:hypothetical protein
VLDDTLEVLRHTCDKLCVSDTPNAMSVLATVKPLRCLLKAAACFGKGIDVTGVTAPLPPRGLHDTLTTV